MLHTRKQQTIQKMCQIIAKVVHTRCQNQSGRTHARLVANKEEISSDGSREQTYSVNNKKLIHIYISNPSSS